MKYFLALDQGTSSTRAILYNEYGEAERCQQAELTQYYPESGWVEHCPDEIWRQTISVIKAVVSPADDIIACGMTNQRETVIAWDRLTGKTLHKAIVWQDRRTSGACEALKEYDPLIQEKTGLLLDSYFSASKIKWLLDNVSECKGLLEKNRLAIGTIDSYLIWRLTDGQQFVTDVTNASRTLLFNIHTLSWDSELLDLFGIPINALAEVRYCDAHFGNINKKWFGLSLPITGVAGDQHAAMIGQACLEAGMVKSTCGTGCFLMLNTGSSAVSSKHNLLTTIAYRTKNELAYGLEGSIFNAGTAVKWLRDEMKLITNASQTEQLAASLKNNGGVYMVPAFTGLGAPHWDAQARGAILGLQRDTSVAHIARAALESVCYQTQDLLECMKRDSQQEINCVRVDGGMVVNNWLLQFLADSCGLVVERPKDIETTARGAAILARLGAGYASSLAKSADNWARDAQFLPQTSSSERGDSHNKWLDAIKKVRA